MGMIVRTVAMSLLAILLAGCDNASQSSKKSQNDADALKKATEKISAPGQKKVAGAATATARTRPKASPEKAALVETGKELFEDNCEACHQADAIGQPGIAPSLTNPELLSIASDKFFISTITDGRDGTPMAAFGEDLKPA